MPVVLFKPTESGGQQHVIVNRVGSDPGRLDPVGKRSGAGAMGNAQILVIQAGISLFRLLGMRPEPENLRAAILVFFDLSDK